MTTSCHGSKGDEMQSIDADFDLAIVGLPWPERLRCVGAARNFSDAQWRVD